MAHYNREQIGVGATTILASEDGNTIFVTGGYVCVYKAAAGARVLLDDFTEAIFDVDASATGFYQLDITKEGPGVPLTISEPLRLRVIGAAASVRAVISADHYGPLTND